GVFSRRSEEDREWWEEAEKEFTERYGNDGSDVDDAASIISGLSMDQRDDSSDADSTAGRLDLDRSTFTGSLRDDLRLMPSSSAPVETPEKKAFQ
ncbi:hypothetical protein PENTCL1PPCAC_20393, partial [Pristionchus entomophagus]